MHKRKGLVKKGRTCNLEVGSIEMTRTGGVYLLWISVDAPSPLCPSEVTLVLGPCSTKASELTKVKMAI